MNSQVQRVYDYLMTGKSLDRITALREIGVLELSARICQLESEGIEIEKDWVNKVNRWGEKYRLRTYKIGR